MFLANINDVLEDIAEVVNKALGPLGSDGFQWSNMRDFFIQLAATLILFVIVKHFFWKPITDLLETRQKATDEELEVAKAASARVKTLEESLKNEKVEAQIQIKEMIDQAEKDAIERKDEIIAGAKAEAKRRLDNVASEIATEIDSKNKEIKEQIVSIAFAAAEKIVAKEIDHDKYLDTVNEIIDGGGKE